ncbi:MAG: Crp/Fnr family transcriptional regulator [Gammaproteobacteria bacterium]|nr:Crp/Fnr family transcriptional regulator [Gammaproteobacteria bacterium]
MEKNSVVLDELHQIPLFSALDEQQLESVLKSSRLVSLAAKTILFEKGTPATHFYLLKSGQVKLYCLSEDGDEKVIEIIHPSQTFAEAIMFMPKHCYPVSAESIKASELYSFDMKQFREMLENSKETCFRLLATMGRQLHSKVNDINNLTLHNATYRLVVYLLEQLPEDAVTLSSIHLASTKVVIASRLSIQPETFSRILLRMSKQGLIEVHGNDITLLDVQGLRDLLK